MALTLLSNYFDSGSRTRKRQASTFRRFFEFRFLRGSRNRVLVSAVVLIAMIALVDWRFENDISFGFLYLFPMLMVGGCLSRSEIAVAALLCTGLTELFDSFAWTATEGSSRLILSFIAFLGTGLYGFASARNRRVTNRQLEAIEDEGEHLRRTEEQLNSVISRSPASIFTLDGSGRVQLANESIHRLLGVEKRQLRGQAIGGFFPDLANVPSAQEAPFFHTEMECMARRQNGDIFLAHIWFSTYQTTAGPRLAAVVFDASDELRNNAEAGLQQVLRGSKVLVGALFHEIRNVCSAIALVHANLIHDRRLADNADFKVLGTLISGLETMAGVELRHSADPMAERISVRPVLEELRVVIESSLRDSEVFVKWEIPQSLPLVWADHQALLQVFLNIAKNSQRALEGMDAMDTASRKELIVRASAEGNCVVVRFVDSGPGVQNPEGLFQPFQKGAHASGLGLYLSRAFVRTFYGDVEHGDIEYEPQVEGCCFAVRLVSAPVDPAGIPERG